MSIYEVQYETHQDHGFWIVSTVYRSLDKQKALDFYKSFEPKPVAGVYRRCKYVCEYPLDEEAWLLDDEEGKGGLISEITRLD